MLKFSGGWYLGDAVSENTLVAINRGILILKSTGRLIEIVDQETGITNGQCGKRKLAVGPLALSIPLLVVTGPLITIIAIIITSSFCIAVKTEQKMDDYEELTPIQSILV